MHVLQLLVGPIHVPRSSAVGTAAVAGSSTGSTRTHVPTTGTGTAVELYYSSTRLGNDRTLLVARAMPAHLRISQGPLARLAS